MVRLLLRPKLPHDGQDAVVVSVQIKDYLPLSRSGWISQPGRRTGLTRAGYYSRCSQYDTEEQQIDEKRS